MFVPTKSCTYQQHTARIARLMEEGFHDGQRWKPEAPARYAELEQYDTPPAPAPQSALKQFAVDDMRRLVDENNAQRLEIKRLRTALERILADDSIDWIMGGKVRDLAQAALETK